MGACGRRVEEASKSERSGQPRNGRFLSFRRSNELAIWRASERRYKELMIALEDLTTTSNVER